MAKEWTSCYLSSELLGTASTSLDHSQVNMRRRRGLQAMGVSPTWMLALPEPSEEELDARLKRAQKLTQHTRPLTPFVSLALAGEPHILALLDDEYFVVHIDSTVELPEPDQRRLGFYLGSRWSEDLVGNNAGATAIELDRPMAVMGPEHYKSALHTWSSLAVPIHDPEGSPIGALALSFPKPTIDIGLLGILLLAAQNVEQNLIIQRRAILQSQVAAWESASSALDTGTDQCGLLLLDASGHVLVTSQSVAKLLHISKEELLGRRLSEFHETASALVEGVKSKVFHSERIAFAQPDGTTKHVQILLIPLVDDKGSPLRFMAIYFDVTTEELLAQHLRRLDRLESVGTIASKMLHEIKNPLASIRAVAQLTGLTHKEETIRQRMDAIVKSADLLNEMILNWLGFSRPADRDLSDTDLSLVLKNLEEMLHSRLHGSNVRLYFRTDPSFPPRKHNQRLLLQALLNIATNGVEALESLPDEAKRRLDIKARVAGSQVTVNITNNGPAIPRHLQTHIFEPLYTTKSKGTGLGLAIAYQIITEIHGGSLTVKSDESLTTFTISLPIR